ncbi:hypothetical protein F4804DRAFT_314005 [Jackrogersella minutella]|nr:hypothetical protein F4804DRAFT_314005 [Jackrogersella minutella]
MLRARLQEFRPRKEAPTTELDKFENVEETWPDKGDREYMTRLRLWRDYVVPRTMRRHLQ